MGSAMAVRSAGSKRVPMVIILGATGTGKTKLSVALAQKFNTEIISADSMQVYKGLDVVTAKASAHERSLVPHHLLDILDPLQHFTVVDFRNRSLKIIDKLIENNKIPIIVGGTNYYMESIIWNILIEDTNDDGQLLWEKTRKRKSSHDKNIEMNPSDEGIKDTDKDNLLQFIINEEKYTNEEIHEKLKEIDPVKANSLHPNNRRKIIRAIDVWVKTGKRQSELLEEQRHTEGQLRRPGSTIVFWLKCEQETHDARINSRVQAMLDNGLISELLDFHDRYNKDRLKDAQYLNKPPDYTKGVFQTLGFKEFHEYLMLDDDKRNTEEGEKLKASAIENMKMGTRRYARRQNKMVLARFLNHPTREIPPIYELDTTNVDKWDEDVQNKAIEIIESFVNGSTCPYESLKPPIAKNVDSDPNSNNYCEICRRIIIGDRVYAIHLDSNKHKNMVKRQQNVPNKDECTN